jgi:hypothetical protein
MSIKSDRWIRRMAAEHRMIEPFEPGQVKEGNGQRIVSYGTSGYGYDIRCSNEFKLFTNLNSTIVDPKNFDDKSFVDVKADSCIMRPSPSPWREPSSTSASRGTYSPSAWGSRPTPAAGSSSTSRPSSPSGRAT